MAELTASAPIPTLINLNGRWASGGTPGPLIGTFLTVHLSAYNRPAACGAVVGVLRITATFPDDATYTWTLQIPDRIQWSNNSFWTKDSPTIKTLIDLNGRWASGGTPGPLIIATSTSFTVDM